MIGDMVTVTMPTHARCGLHCTQKMKYPVRQIGVDRTSGDAFVVHEVIA